MARRRRKRTRNGRLRRRAHSLFYALEALICFGVLGGIGYAFSNYMAESPRFQMQRVIVQGANVLREESILKASGATSEDNVLLFDADIIRRRIEAMPYVKHCKVQRVYPNTILIIIEERAAVATLMVNNRAFTLDEEAVVLREIGSLGAHDGPLITSVPSLGVVEVGETIESIEVTTALALWRAFSNVSISRTNTVSEIAATAQNELYMYCNELPFELRWGRSDFTLQAQRLDILLREKDGTLPCTEYLDLRFDEDLVCK